MGFLEVHSMACYECHVKEFVIRILFHQFDYLYTSFYEIFELHVVIVKFFVNPEAVIWPVLKTTYKFQRPFDCNLVLLHMG